MARIPGEWMRTQRRRNCPGAATRQSGRCSSSSRQKPACSAAGFPATPRDPIRGNARMSRSVTPSGRSAPGNRMSTVSPGRTSTLMPWAKKSSVRSRSAEAKASRLGSPVVPDVLSVTIRAMASSGTQTNRFQPSSRLPRRRKTAIASHRRATRYIPPDRLTVTFKNASKTFPVQQAVTLRISQHLVDFVQLIPPQRFFAQHLQPTATRDPVIQKRALHHTRPRYNVVPSNEVRLYRQNGIKVRWTSNMDAAP